MDALSKLKAFVATAETGTFSDAARRARVSPSVIMKRINELEADFDAPLFSRSTRRVTLTDVGQLYLPRIQRLVKEYEDLRSGTFRAPGALEGLIRVKALTAPFLKYLGKPLAEFQQENPRLRLSVTTTEFPGNPIEEGFDIAIGTDVSSYEGVFEERLHAYPCVVCASPAYLQRKGVPAHPSDLLNHDCLAFSPAGSVWSFQTPRGPLNIDVHPVFASNNPQYLSSLTCDGGGIALLSSLTAAPAIEATQLTPVLEDYPLLTDRWVKVMIPETRMRLARVQALLEIVRTAFAPLPS